MIYSVEYSVYCACCGEVSGDKEYFSTQAAAAERLAAIETTAQQQHDLEMVFVEVCKKGSRLATFNKALSKANLWFDNRQFCHAYNTAAALLPVMEAA